MYIENEAAYEAAKARRIQENARKTGKKVWFAEHADAQRLTDYLNSQGEFASEWVEGPRGWKQVHCPIKFPSGSFGEFLLTFRDRLQDWGKLSPKQTQIVRDALAKAEQFAAERDVKIAAKRAVDCTKAHVGTVGERIVFDLTVERVLSFESEFGLIYINLCRDADGNVIVYKGSNRFDLGAIKVKATIKSHETREGVPQTLISRPKEV